MTEEANDPFDELTEADVDDVEEFEELFAESSVDDIDSESLWSELETDGTTGSEVDEAVSAEISVVPKRAFCQECPHLSEAPTVSCTHEGTEILDFPDKNHIRVRNCPIVEERGGIMTAEESELND